MAKYRAIPHGFLTVGQVAKKMGVTVRTLQYYDRVGVLSPSAESEGGRRLYTEKDFIRLHQILSLKSLGFSLEDIKQRLPSLEAPADVANALAEQAGEIRKEIERLTASLKAIEQLKTEVLQMQTVNFKKYADIIVNLQMHNEYYWLIKHFDEDMLDHIRSRFDKDSGMAFMDRFNRLNEEILRLRQEELLPEDPKVQEAAEKFWNMVMEFTGGDMSLLPKLMELGNFREDENDPGWAKRQAMANAYIEPALGLYLQRINLQMPGEETEQEKDS